MKLFNIIVKELCVRGIYKYGTITIHVYVYMHILNNNSEIP